MHCKSQLLGKLEQVTVAAPDNCARFVSLPFRERPPVRDDGPGSLGVLGFLTVCRGHGPGAAQKRAQASEIPQDRKLRHILEYSFLLAALVGGMRMMLRGVRGLECRISVAWEWGRGWRSTRNTGTYS